MDFIFWTIQLAMSIGISEPFSPLQLWRHARELVRGSIFLWGRQRRGWPRRDRRRQSQRCTSHRWSSSVVTQTSSCTFQPWRSQWTWNIWFVSEERKKIFSHPKLALSNANFQALLMLKWSHIMAIMLSMMKPMMIMSNFLLLMIPNTIAWVLQRISLMEWFKEGFYFFF